MGRKQTDETKRKISISLGGKGLLKKKEKVCLNCGTPLGQCQYKYCSKKCSGRYLYEQRVKKWLSGELDGSANHGHAEYVKRYLLEKYNNQCSKCGWSEINPYTKTLPLEVEHIDGDAYNNDPSNVTLLCPNCQSLTKTYRGANKGNGKRKYLKKTIIRLRS